MKTLTLIAAMALSFNVQAESGKAASTESTCDSFAGLAKNIMTARQRGMDMSVAIKLIAGSGIEDIAKPMIVSAYGEPLQASESMKKSVSTEFSNGFYLGCLKELEK